MEKRDPAPTARPGLRVGFVLDYVPNLELIPKEAILSRDSYIDRWLLSLLREGVEGTKYVPYRGISKTESHRHAFGHAVKLVPVRHPLLPLVRSTGGPQRDASKPNPSAERAEMLGFSLNLRRELVRDRKQIVHYVNYFSSSFSFSPLAAGKASVVAWWSGGDIPRDFSKWAWFFALQPALMRSKGVMIGPYPERRLTLSWLLRGSEQKMEPFQLIRVDQGLFRPLDRSEARRRLGRPQDSLEIVSVLSLIPLPHNDPNNRQPYLMLRELKAALSMMGGGREVNLTVLGTGPGLEPLRGLARELGISERVRFPGRVEHNELPTHYAAADVVFVPYFMEALNETNVLAEAFSCGRMVAAFRRREGIRASQPGGVLLSPRPEDGAPELAAILARPPLIEEKSREALALSGPFSLETAGRDLLAAYSEIMLR